MSLSVNSYAICLGSRFPLSGYGDEAADLIWRNKSALLVGTALTAVLADPKPFIHGIMILPTTPIERIVPQVDWTLIIALAIVSGVIMLGDYLWLTGRIKRHQPESFDSP